MMAYLTQLDGMTVTPRHLFWLDTMCRLDYDLTEAREMLGQAAKGELQFFGFRGDKGLVVTQMRDSKRGKVLVVYGLAGKGIFAAGQGVMNDLRTYAREQNCRLIDGYSQVSKHGSFFSHLGMSPVATRFVMEV